MRGRYGCMVSCVDYVSELWWGMVAWWAVWASMWLYDGVRRPWVSWRWDAAAWWWCVGEHMIRGGCMVRCERDLELYMGSMGVMGWSWGGAAEWVRCKGDLELHIGSMGAIGWLWGDAAAWVAVWHTKSFTQVFYCFMSIIWTPQQIRVLPKRNFESQLIKCQAFTTSLLNLNNRLL